MSLRIAHLYPQTMSTYGDLGNITCLVRRCEWRNIAVTVIPIEIGEEIPADIDLYFFGGGQDVAQTSVGNDLIGKKGQRILNDARAGVPILAICGGYQLLGSSYQPAEGPQIPGLGLFPVTTVAGSKRLIGDLVLTADPRLSLGEEHPTIVGFENHSGNTSSIDVSIDFPLGTVRHGGGNNGSDGTEGCCVYSSIGCYLHGSLLPKNPHLADWLIQKALTHKGIDQPLAKLDDTMEWEAHQAIVGRYM
ncbi:MAG: glutamine amidotransferase [bacterium]